MTFTTTALIELIVGLIGICTTASGVAAWATADRIRHEIGHSIKGLKTEVATLRRRTKLLESFAVNLGFSKSPSEGVGDTDL